MLSWQQFFEEKEKGDNMNNKFAFSLLEKMDDENLFFSPFSIETALGMCALGASGPTRQEMCEVLGLSQDEKTQEKQAKESNEFFTSPSDNYQLKCANDLWVHNEYQLNKVYQESVECNYGGTVNVVDYIENAAATVKTINDHIAKVTENKIKNLISRSFINKETRLILTNAVYFKSNWAHKFDKQATKEENFQLQNGKTKKLPLMHNKKKYDYYDNNPDFQVVDLPYVGEELSMTVVLPKKKNSLSEVQNKFTEEKYNEAIYQMTDNDNVVLTLPRFKVETPVYKMKPVLNDLGMRAAFSDHAAFDKLAAQGQDALKISEVLHKAFVEVNEEGTEAAAATAVGMMRCTSVMRPPVAKEITFCADHSFLYFIRHRPTNKILFSGRFEG